MPLLTTIVPVYNVEKYIRTGLESLLVQGMRDGEHEILLIDDGSTDSSGRICDEYAAKYPSLIRVIHKPNGGVSSARNLGIREAKGDYIHFMDADDYMDLESYRILLDAAINYDTDYLGFHDHRNVDARFQEVTPIMHTSTHEEFAIIYEGDGHEMIKENRLTVFSTRSLMRRAFILKNDLLFREGVAIAEDGEFNFRMMACRPSVVLSTSNAYNSVMRPGSAVTDRAVGRDEKWIAGCINMVTTLNIIMSELPVVAEGIMKWRNQYVAQFIPKILRFKLSKENSRKLVLKLQELHAIPVVGSGYYYCAINFLLRHPELLPISSVLYRKIFYPYIYPLFVKFILK